MAPFPDSRHSVTLLTARGEPILKGEMRRLVEHAVRALPARYPGLRILRQSVGPDRVELEMEFHRLDEDLQRVLQSLKSEVRSLARRKNLPSENLWQWGHKEE
jgi:hypothetical protein